MHPGASTPTTTRTDVDLLFQHFAGRDTPSVDDLMDAIGGNHFPPKPQHEVDAADAAHEKRRSDYEAAQTKRPGLNPGDDISTHQMGREYPHAQWVPLHVAQRFRDHHGDQHNDSSDIVYDLTKQLKSGRGVTDPLMLLHHNEARVAHLGEGNHRLKAMENAGWTHVPMRVVRMYDGESKDYLHQPEKHIPLHWLGSHIGRTPDMCAPSEVFNFGSKAYPGDHEQEGSARGQGTGEHIGRRGGPLALLRWVAAGKSRRRDRRDRQGPGDQGPVEPDAPGVEAPPEPKPVTWHSKAAKDLKALHANDQKQILARIEDLRVDDPIALSQTHPLYTRLRGWSVTKASRGHRIVHKPTEDGGIHIGWVGLHDYEVANRRLKGSILGGLVHIAQEWPTKHVSLDDLPITGEARDRGQHHDHPYPISGLDDPREYGEGFGFKKGSTWSLHRVPLRAMNPPNVNCKGPGGVHNAACYDRDTGDYEHHDNTSDGDLNDADDVRGMAKKPHELPALVGIRHDSGYIGYFGGGHRTAAWEEAGWTHAPVWLQDQD